MVTLPEFNFQLNWIPLSPSVIHLKIYPGYHPGRLENSNYWHNSVAISLGGGDPSTVKGPPGASGSTKANRTHPNNHSRKNIFQEKKDGLAAVFVKRDYAIIA